MSKDEIGDRMKFYENETRMFLKAKTPIIIRIDGKAFHSLTRGLSVFDPKISEAMITTAMTLCNEIQGAQLAYTQSDEISIFIRDWDRPETQIWFNGNIQKIVSVSASMATYYFNQKIRISDKPAFFDSRVFNVPINEVTNYFIWRQLDCRRNSISSWAREFFPHRKLEGVNSEQMIKMLEDINQPWSVLDTWKRYGTGINRIPENNKFKAMIYMPWLITDRSWVESALKPNTN
jgi:tRNA(His) guanylyltransferase